jgi:negative regulator of flagellin synthesis FlgM
MKIGQPREPLAGTAAAGETKATPLKGNARADASASTSSSAKVNLSDAVSGLLAGKEVDGDVFDAAKVNRLATAIAQGKFVVNPALVADKLIANALELLDKKTH